MRRARIAVLVSGGGTNLGAMIAAERDGIIKSGEIALVISNNPSAYALERAKLAGIPTALAVKRELGSTEAFEGRIKALLSEYEIDLIVLAGFMSILSEDFTRDYPRRIINVHPALIPAFCGKGYYGLHVHEAVLEYGCKVSGATVHFVNEIPDGGEIILQKAVPVLKNDTPEKLQKRIMERAEWKLLPRAVELVSREITANK